MLFVISSCSSNDFNEMATGMGSVAFNIMAPGEVTKAYIGDGENVNIVHYEIYLAQNSHKNSVNGGEPLVEGTVEMVDKRAQLRLNLLEDQDYVALFWAQVDGKKFYDVDDLRNVVAYYSDENGKYILSNNEDRAAFCQVYPFNTEEEGIRTVELVRPFAQLNLGTVKESLDMDYHIDLLESKMTVSGVGVAYNVAAMKTGSAAADVVFDFAAVPDQMLDVNDVAYAYAGMNYFFVPSDEGNVDVVYDIMTDVGKVNRTVSNVPVKKNYRTNIIGNLLTKETIIEIIVDEKFNKEDEVVEGESKEN